MKRDMDVIRKIVLALRETASISKVDGIEAHTFAEHVQLLEERGLVQAKVMRSQGQAEAAVAFRLTWEGQDFADSIQDKTLWEKAKVHVLAPGAAFSFQILKEYLAKQVKDSLGL